MIELIGWFSIVLLMSGVLSLLLGFLFFDHEVILVGICLLIGGSLVYTQKTTVIQSCQCVNCECDTCCEVDEGE